MEPENRFAVYVANTPSQEFSNWLTYKARSFWASTSLCALGRQVSIRLEVTRTVQGVDRT